MEKRRYETGWKETIFKGMAGMLLLLCWLVGMRNYALAAEPAVDDWKLRIEYENRPVNRIVGESFSPQGRIYSNHRLENIFLVVYDSNGKEVVSSMRTNLGIKQYDIKDMRLDFTKIPVGKDYTYIVAARDQFGKKNLVKVRFDVMEPSQLGIRDYGYLGTLTRGNGFKIAGILVSNYQLKTCYAAIYDQNGTIIADKAVELKGNAFDLVNMTLDAGHLPAGNYTYRLAARDEVGKKTLICEKLKIVEPVDSYTQKVSEFISNAKWKQGASWSAGKTPTISSYGGTGCCAYAADFVKYVFGSDKVRDGAAFANPDEIRSGDVLYVSGTSHWIVVLHRNGSKLTTAEGNWAGKVVISDCAYSVVNHTLMRDGKKFRTFETGYHYQ